MRLEKRSSTASKESTQRTMNGSTNAQSRLSSKLGLSCTTLHLPKSSFTKHLEPKEQAFGPSSKLSGGSGTFSFSSRTVGCTRLGAYPISLCDAPLACGTQETPDTANDSGCRVLAKQLAPLTPSGLAACMCRAHVGFCSSRPLVASSRACAAWLSRSPKISPKKQVSLAQYQRQKKNRVHDSVHDTFCWARPDSQAGLAAMKLARRNARLEQ